MRLAMAITVRRVTADGLCELRDGVPLGLNYLVDLDSMREADIYNTEHDVLHVKEVVTVVDDQPPHGSLGWLPTEVIKIQERA